MNVDLEADYDELYLSYNWKFSNEFNSTNGGKLPGLGGLPDFGPVQPVSGMDSGRIIYLNTVELYHHIIMTAQWIIHHGALMKTAFSW